MYRDRLEGVQILLSKSQAGPGRTIGDALLKSVDRHGGIRLQFIHIFERMIVDPNILEELALNRCQKLNGKKITYLLCEICTNYGSLFLPCLAGAQMTMFDFVLIGDLRRGLPSDDSNSDRLCCRGHV